MNQNRLARWCLILALVACGLAAGLAQAAPAAPGFPAAAPAHPAATPPGMDAEAVKELKEKIKTLEERERSNYAMAIETQRKSVDWWLGGISGLIALLAFAGAIIPYVFTQSERGRLALAQVQTDKALHEARKALDDIQKHAVTAAQASQDTQKARDEAKLQLAAIKSGEPVTPEESAKHQKAATQVLSDPDADDLSKLRALAVKADEANDAALASHLWQAVAAKAPEDATALFNAAYWLQESLSKQSGAVSPAEWQRVSALYEAHCARNPKSDSGYNNWGSALLAEARSICVDGSLVEARKLFALAGLKYQRALQIKGDDYDATYNWGNALLHEANAVIAAGDLPEARRLWALAGAQYKQALKINGSPHQATNNWGTALFNEANAVLAAGDLPEARRLWALAGAQYKQALEIKGDKHEAARNWGNALLQETTALERAGEKAEATKLLHQALDLLKTTAVQSTEGAKSVSYLLACTWARMGEVAQCMAQLQIAQTAGKLPDAARLDSASDLAAVRSTPEYQAWRRGLPAPWNPVVGDPQPIKGTP